MSARSRNPMWRRYLRFMGPDPRADVNDELRFHMQELERQFLAQGKDAVTARREAERQFGDLEATRRALADRTAAMRRRTARAEWWRGVASDARLGVRKLLHQPVFALVAVATLGLGIGASTAIFSVVNSVLLRPLPYAQPQQLYVIREIIPEMAKTYPTLPANLPNFRTWQRDVPAFSDIALVDHTARVLTGAGEPVEINGARVSANLFETLGVVPRMGRTFRADEDQSGHDHEVILTDETWRQRFQADPSILSRTIALDGESYVVVGVLPSSFRFPTGEQLGPLVQLGSRVEFFKPLGVNAQDRNPIGEFNFAAIARLKSGVTPAQALASLNVVQARIARDAKRGVDLKAVLWPLEAQIVGDARDGLLFLLGGVGVVLLLVCVNLANLMLAQVPGRMRDAAIRTALGASRARLVRQMLTETALLGVVGGLVGIALAYVGMQALLSIAPPGMPRLDEVRMDGRVLWFATFVSVATGLMFGALPAWRVARAQPQHAIKGSETRNSEQHGTRRLRSTLIGVEVALSTVLLIVGSLLAFSLARVLGSDTGFERNGVLAVDVNLPPQQYAGPERRVAFYHRVSEAVERLPGVTHAGWVSKLPLTGETSVSSVSVPGKSELGQQPMANYRLASFNYFASSGIPIRRGRMFDERDRGRNVVVISQSVADRLWPGENPIGKICSTQWGETLPQEVIGVVADVPTAHLDVPRPAMLYMPEWAPPMVWYRSGFSFTIRTSVLPQSIASAVRRVMHDIDPAVAITALRPLSDVVAGSVQDRRFHARLAAIFAACALMLAAIGIYGVVSYSVEQRKQELGIRIALGAARADIRRLVLQQGMRPVAFGLIGGVLTALAMGRLLGSLLFGIAAQDPSTIAGVVVVILLVAVLACWLPATRATRLDPIRAWRGE